MKKIAKIFLVFIALAALVYFFAIDSVIKTLIERQASQALRARVDIAGATFHLLPTSLTLRGVQVTNPQQPANNLLQADSVSAPLQLGELFERKLIIDTLQLQGLRFAQKRAQSGAIEGLTPAPVAAGVQTPAVGHPQTRQHGDIHAAREELIRLRNDWQERLRGLPTSEQLGEYRFRAQGKDAANRARLRSEIGDELARVRKLQEEFSFDFERVKPQLNVSGVPQAAPVQLPGGAPVSITGALLSRELTPVLRHLLGFVPTAATTENDDPTQWKILIRKAVVNGEINLGASPLRLTGAVENITPQPRRFDAVTTFQLQSAPEQIGKFNASGSIDLRKLPLQNIRFNLEGFPVSNLSLSTDDELRIGITHATADIQGLLALTGNQIDINMLARFQNAELEVAAGDSAISRAAATTLRSARDFDLNFQASGNVAHPVLTLNSSLDKLLTNAVNQELNAAAGDAAPETQALRQLGAELLQIQQTLLGTQAALQSLLDM